jgi:hypothetical protein
MAEITLPEVKLPDIRLPGGLREMTRDDIVHAAKDVRMPKMELPSRIEIPDIDLSKVDLPKPIADRLPKRRRSNPLMPIAGLFAIGAVIAGIWYLVTSPVTGPRVKHAFNDLRARMNGQSNDLVRYDNDSDLGSLVSDRTADMPGSDYETANAARTTGTTIPSSRSGVAVGPGDSPTTSSSTISAREEAPSSAF